MCFSAKGMQESESIIVERNNLIKESYWFSNKKQCPKTMSISHCNAIWSVFCKLVCWVCPCPKKYVGCLVRSQMAHLDKKASSQWIKPTTHWLRKLLGLFNAQVGAHIRSAPTKNQSIGYPDVPSQLYTNQTASVCRYFFKGGQFKQKNPSFKTAGRVDDKSSMDSSLSEKPH